MTKSNLIVIGLLSVMTLVAACTGGNGNFFSGHQVGIHRSSQILDLGEYRIEVAEMRSARNFPIPETRYFSFSWSPLGYQRIFNERKWRLPTDDDWQGFLEMQLKVIDLSQSPSRSEMRNFLIKRHQVFQAEQASADYKARVRSDGQIVMDLCSGTVSGRHHCANELTITQQNKLRLAQIALDRFDAGCTLGRIDPPSVTVLMPYYKSGPLSLVVEIICD